MTSTSNPSVAHVYYDEVVSMRSPPSIEMGHWHSLTCLQHEETLECKALDCVKHFVPAGSAFPGAEGTARASATQVENC